MNPSVRYSNDCPMMKVGSDGKVAKNGKLEVGAAQVEQHIGLTPHALKALVFQLVESASLSSRWFQIDSACATTSRWVCSLTTTPTVGAVQA